jgi:hypothetical protein
MKSFYKEIGCGEIGRMSTVAEGYFANFLNTVNKHLCANLWGKISLLLFFSTNPRRKLAELFS